MTTKEIAQKLGVSRVTVSKVINGKSGVSQETADKIKKYMNKNNFAPSISARNLAGKKNKIIGLFSKNSPVSQNEEEITSHFSSDFTNHVINKAQQEGYNVLVSVVTDENQYGEIGKAFNSGLIAGAILLGYETQNKKILELSKKGHEMILINQEEKKENVGNNTSLVNMSDEEGSYYAIKELLEEGYNRILYIGSDKKRLPAIRRLRGVNKCYEENKEKLKEFFLENGDFTKKSGYLITKKILERNIKLPLGIFTANDFMALGAIKAVLELGYKIPQEISIIGFDDVAVSKYTTPALSTIKCDFEKMAEMATGTLLNIIRKKEYKKIQECEVVFIGRDTTKK